MVASADVRYEGLTPTKIRYHFENINGTAVFDVEGTDATLSELDVPTAQANGSISLSELNALNNNIETAKTDVGKFPFIQSVL